MSRLTQSFVVALVGTVVLAYITGLGPFDGGVRGPGSATIERNGAADDPESPGYGGDPYPTKQPAEELFGGDLTPARYDSHGVAVLFDGGWAIEEGQWWLADSTGGGNGEVPSFDRILESAGPSTAYVTVPGKDGRYRTRLELHQAPPPTTPAWCEDLAEASLWIGRNELPSGLMMGSFASFTDTFEVPQQGWYRVRYCTEKQDTAARQDEFTGKEYIVYAGRHLLQLWRAPRAPDRILRQDSRWARSLTKN